MESWEGSLQPLLMWQPNLDEQHVRLKLQVEAKPLVGPGSGTIGDCQKKDRAYKIWQGTHTPCSLARRPWESGNMLFSKTKPLFFNVCDNTMLYVMLSLAD